MQIAIYRPFKYTCTIASIWRENMLGYLSADIICFEQGTLCFEGQIITKDKYPSIFSRVYYSSNPSRNTRSFENWGTFSDIPQFNLGNIWSRGVFRPIAHERKYFFYVNCRNSPELIGKFLLSICGQTHEFKIHATRQGARAGNSTICQ